MSISLKWQGSDKKDDKGGSSGENGAAAFCVSG